MPESDSSTGAGVGVGVGVVLGVGVGVVVRVGVGDMFSEELLVREGVVPLVGSGVAFAVETFVVTAGAGVGFGAGVAVVLLLVLLFVVVTVGLVADVAPLVSLVVCVVSLVSELESVCEFVLVLTLGVVASLEFSSAVIATAVGISKASGSRVLDSAKITRPPNKTDKVRLKITSH